MTPLEHYLSVHRATSSMADCIYSLSIAADVVSEGGSLPDEKKRKEIVLGILEAIRIISSDLLTITTEHWDEAEKQMRKSKAV